MYYALILIVCYLAILFVARWSARAVVALALITVAVSVFAADVPTDTNWPSMGEQSQPVLVAHNVFGNRIVLFANFCSGDAARRDHMHTYGIYDSHNQFIQGGCWKFDPVGTRKMQAIAYFDLGAAGWDKWPLHAFRPVRALNVQCRGNSGDDPRTQHACNERDAAQFN